MRSQRPPATWARRTELGRRIFNYNVRLDALSVEGWRLAKVAPLTETPVSRETVYLWQNSATPQPDMVRVDVFEAADWRAAQRALQAALVACMRPDLPEDDSRLGRVGDVVVVGREDPSDAAASIFFARGNLTVLVRSVGPVSVDASAFAVTIDELLAGPPPAKATEAPVLDPRAVARPRRIRGPAVGYDLTAIPNGWWFKLIAPSGDVAREGNLVLCSAAAQAVGGGVLAQVFDPASIG